MLNSKGVSYAPAKANMSDPLEENNGEMTSTLTKNRYKVKDFMEKSDSESSNDDSSNVPIEDDDHVDQETRLGFRPEDPIIVPAGNDSSPAEIPLDKYISSMKKKQSKKIPRSTKATSVGVKRKKIQEILVQRQTLKTKEDSDHDDH